MEPTSVRPRFANELSELRGALQPTPLSKEELSVYSADLNKLRGRDVVAELMVGFREPDWAGPFKAFLCGRSGTGKSTEISKLEAELNDSHVFVRFDVERSLDPDNFTSFDIVLIMVNGVLTAFKEMSLALPDPALGQAVLEWFSRTRIQEVEKFEIDNELTAGLGIDPKSGWTLLLPIFAKLTTSLKSKQHRDVLVVKNAYSRISDLIESTNIFLVSAQEKLRDQKGKKLVIVGESFDKSSIPRQPVIDFFDTYRSVIQEIDCPLILNLPVDLPFSDSAKRLPEFQKFVLRDIAVYDQTKAVNEDVIQRMRSLLSKRMLAELIEEDAFRMCVLASGGSVRQLFTIIIDSSTKARRDRRTTIGVEDVKSVVLEFRSTVVGWAATSPNDGDVSWEEKVDRLVAIYRNPSVGFEQDEVFQALIRSSLLLEHNGTMWFGLHPMAVEFLKLIDRLPSDALGGLPGAFV